MTQLIEYTAFIIFSTTLFRITLWIQRAFSDTNYSDLKFALSIYYKIIPIFIHTYIQATQSVYFYGQLEIYVPGWLTVVIINAHLFCIPVPHVPFRWFLKRKVDPRIRVYK
ncbi:hypothetical protein BB779_11690 [Pseudomonas viridiflava]|nr:hypothetical protein BB779_11690 [Pseudomonas viridiflava]